MITIYLQITYMCSFLLVCCRGCEVEENAESVVTQYHTKLVTRTITETIPFVEIPTEVPSIDHHKKKVVVDVEFKSRVLKAHNIIRKRHNVQLLSWSDDLYYNAQKFANEEFVCNGSLEHSFEYIRREIGENLALGYNEIEQAIDAFYSGVKHIDFEDLEKTTDNKKTQHFTQLVWKNTHQIGCGYVYCGEYYKNFFICQYSNKGNVEGEFNDNVFKPVY